MKNNTFENLSVGLSAEARYPLTKDLYEHFLAAFSDKNPLHVDSQYAKEQGFKDCVMHGAILNGILSHFIGTELPGKNALLLSTDIRYHHANYLNDVLVLKGKVHQRLESQRVVVIQFEVWNETQKYISARGISNVKVRE